MSCAAVPIAYEVVPAPRYTICKIPHYRLHDWKPVLGDKLLGISVGKGVVGFRVLNGLIIVTAQFDASRRGKKVLNYCCEKIEAAYPAVGRGEKSLLSDPGSELRVKKEKEKKKSKTHGMSK